MNDRPPVSVSTLLIPQGSFHVVLPGALVAQVVSRIGEIVAVPAVEAWMLGLVAWRSLAVPVISLESLFTGKPAPEAERGRLVVCYPLPGRDGRDFFALAAPAGVHTHTVDGTTGAVKPPRELRPDLVASAISLGDGVVGVIPDLNRVSEIVYRGGR